MKNDNTQGGFNIGDKHNVRPQIVSPLTKDQLRIQFLEGRLNTIHKHIEDVTPSFANVGYIQSLSKIDTTI